MCGFDLGRSCVCVCGMRVCFCVYCFVCLHSCQVHDQDVVGFFCITGSRSGRPFCGGVL